MPESRRDQRNFLPALILTLIWWLSLALIVLFVDPDVLADFPLTGSYGLFFGILFLAVWFLFSLLLINTRRGLLVALGVVLFGYLRLWQLGGPLNAILLAGVLIATEVYISGRKLTTTPGSRTTTGE